MNLQLILLTGFEFDMTRAGQSFHAEPIFPSFPAHLTRLFINRVNRISINFKETERTKMKNVPIRETFPQRQVQRV